jgi:signal transduction histidine kinase
VDPEGPYLLYFAATALLLVVGAQLADRFVTSLREAEQAAAARERAIADERQRIMQDMHDGLGSQLLTSLALAERGALDGPGMAQLLRESIDDMRLAIDTLSPGKDGLLEALGNLRYRLEPRFRAAGIELRFQAHDLPDRLTVPPEAALQILRVLQESLTNVLKHAGPASRAWVRLQWRPDALELSVLDDGRGASAAMVGSDGEGQGVRGMVERAQLHGGRLETGPRPGGGFGVHAALPYGVRR